MLTFQSLTHTSEQICVCTYHIFSVLYLQFVCPNFQVNGRVCVCVLVYADVEREINAVLEFLINCQFDEKFVTTTTTNAEYTHTQRKANTHILTHTHSHIHSQSYTYKQMSSAASCSKVPLATSFKKAS